MLLISQPLLRANLNGGIEDYHVRYARHTSYSSIKVSVMIIHENDQTSFNNGKPFNEDGSWKR